MNWPPIDVPVIGRSGFIALIALLHIPFFVNFVMGAPVIAVIAEWMGRRTGDKRYGTLSRHLSTMALVTVGVGAFGGIALVAANIGLFPAFFATGAQVFFVPLVAEIGAFLVEAIFIAVYRYTWTSMAYRTSHMLLGLLGAFGAWLSGFIINGLASFMLTPGSWVQTKSLLDAALNPSSLASFTHRAVAAFSITGFFLVVYALWMYRRAKESDDYDYARWSLRHAGQWAVLATAFQVVPGVWYLGALQVGTANAAPEGSVIPKFLSGELTFFWVGAILLGAVAAGLVWFLAVRRENVRLGRTTGAALMLAVVLILASNAFMGFSRERARKPYLIYGVMYGNEMMAKLPSAAAAGDARAGQTLFSGQCAGCHGLKGQGGALALDGIGARMSAAQVKQTLQSPPAGMPKFGGSAGDLDALTAFLASQK